MKFILLAISATLLIGCTDTEISKISAYGEAASIKCYSGGKLIYYGKSTGRVLKESSGADGYAFRDAATDKLKEVSGDCNVTYGVK